MFAGALSTPVDDVAATYREVAVIIELGRPEVEAR
jgi:hypothetical protein